MTQPAETLPAQLSGEAPHNFNPELSQDSHIASLLNKGRIALEYMADYVGDRVAVGSHRAVTGLSILGGIVGGGVAANTAAAAPARGGVEVNTALEASTSHPAGIFLTGPLTGVEFSTPYTYDVEVVSNKSYKHALVTFFVPSLNKRVPRPTSLVAHRPRDEKFTTTFADSPSLSTAGLAVSVMVQPPHHGYKPLFSKKYPVTPAEGQAPAQPSSGDTPPAYFGS